MNPFKNHDWKHVLAYVACVAVLGACQIPDVHPYQATILMIVAPLFLYAGITLPQAGYGSNEAAKVLAAAKKVAIVLLLVAWSAALALAGSAPLEGCTHEQTTQVENILPNAAQCLDKVLGDVNGVIDIPGTMQSCGVTIEQLVTYLEEYFAKPDAGAALASENPSKVQRASKMLDAARAYQKAHAK